MSHLAFRGVLDGREVELHIGGEHDGYLVADGERLRQATPEEIESAKRAFWPNHE